MSDWRSALTREEANKLDIIEAVLSKKKAEVAMVQKARRTLYLRAKKRSARDQKSVDMQAITH